MSCFGGARTRCLGLTLSDAVPGPLDLGPGIKTMAFLGGTLSVYTVYISSCHPLDEAGHPSSAACLWHEEEWGYCREADSRPSHNMREMYLLPSGHSNGEIQANHNYLFLKVIMFPIQLVRSLSSLISWVPIPTLNRHVLTRHFRAPINTPLARFPNLEHLSLFHEPPSTFNSQC